MPISEQCLNYFVNLTEKYPQQGQKDENFKTINKLISQLLHLLKTDNSEISEELLICDLARSVAAMKGENPQFKKTVQEFLKQCNKQLKPYTARSRSLTLVDEEGELLQKIEAPAPFVATKAKPVVSSFPPSNSRFFQDIHFKAEEFATRRRLGEGKYSCKLR